METKNWLSEISRAIDTKDTEKFIEFLTDDCIFRFGNQPDVSGKKETKEFVLGFFKIIAGSTHKVLNFWENNNSVVWQGEVLYDRLDGKKVTVNFVNIFFLKGRLIKEYLIYIDNSPLFA